MKELIAAFLAIFGIGNAMAEDIQLEAGQVWTFYGAPQEDSRLIIGEIEPFGDGSVTAVSVSITGLPLYPLPNGELGGGKMHHLPFEKETLISSLAAMKADAVELPAEYFQGYATWKAAVEAGEAGVFTITVEEVCRDIYLKIAGSVD